MAIYVKFDDFSCFTGAAILTPMFKLGKDLESEEFVAKIVPCIIKLFASNDRNARFKLLQQVSYD